jgi:dTDP-4-dehydrorhamnose reductase
MCADASTRVAVLSSSRVLAPPGPRTEDAEHGPACLLGEAQARGERAILRAHPGAVVVRSGVLVGLDHPRDPLRAGLAIVRDGGRWKVPADASAVLASVLAHAVLDLLADGEGGVWHVAHRRPLCALARKAVVLAGLDPAGVVAEPSRAVRLATSRAHIIAPCTPGLRDLVASARFVEPDTRRGTLEAP